jgi:hypothetical protein
MKQKTPVVLIYKRTHTGDPDSNGIFGIHECMGRVRSYEFDSVIGLGGEGREPVDSKIDKKITYIGIGAKWFLSLFQVHVHPQKLMT